MKTKRAMKPAIIMILLLVVPLTGGHDVLADSENPFGFETQTHPLKYGYCRKDPDPHRHPHRYECSSAPRSHPDFYVYQLNFVEDVGLCAISSWTLADYIKDDLENLIEKLKEQIAKKYGSGRPEKTSVVSVYIWDKKAGFNGLGDVEQIRMKKWAKPVGGSLPYVAYGIVVHFRLKNMGLCQGKIYEKGNQAF